MATEYVTKQKRKIASVWVCAAGITVALLFVLAVYGVKAPEVKSGRFPFTVTYEYMGETTVIEDVFVCEYQGADKGLFYSYRNWSGEKEQGGFGNHYVIWENGSEYIYLLTGMDARYYMGDPTYRETELYEGRTFHAPQGYYRNDETDEESFSEEELAKRGFKIISYDYPEPVQNSFRFAGVDFHGGTVVSLVVISAVIILCLLILVRKDKEYRYSAIDITSMACNGLICACGLPFMIAMAVLWGIDGTSESGKLFIYAAPIVTVWGIGASILLRRKGIKMGGFFIQFLGPIVFVGHLLSL